MDEIDRAEQGYSVAKARKTAEPETEWSPHFMPGASQGRVIRELQIVVENLSKRIAALETQIERIPA